MGVGVFTITLFSIVTPNWCYVYWQTLTPTTRAGICGVLILGGSKDLTTNYEELVGSRAFSVAGKILKHPYHSLPFLQLFIGANNRSKLPILFIFKHCACSFHNFWRDAWRALLKMYFAAIQVVLNIPNCGHASAPFCRVVNPVVSCVSLDYSLSRTLKIMRQLFWQRGNESQIDNLLVLGETGIVLRWMK